MKVRKFLIPTAVGSAVYRVLFSLLDQVMYRSLNPTVDDLNLLRQIYLLPISNDLAHVAGWDRVFCTISRVFPRVGSVLRVQILRNLSQRQTRNYRR